LVERECLRKRQLLEITLIVLLGVGVDAVTLVGINVFVWRFWGVKMVDDEVSLLRVLTHEVSTSPLLDTKATVVDPTKFVVAITVFAGWALDIRHNGGDG